MKKGAGGRRPRLTLGIKDDDVSILDAFNEEAAHIGGNVSVSCCAWNGDADIKRKGEHQ